MIIDENIYRTNGFRILGLDITSSNTKIENRIAQIDFYRSTKNFKDYEPLKGAFDKSETDFLMPVRPEPSYNEYQNAKNRLYDVERRFIDELFWFWPETLDGQLDEEIVKYLSQNKYGKAIKYWEDTSDTNSLDVTSMHNLSILHHMRALDGFFEGKGNKDLFNDLELSLNYWYQLLNSDNFRGYVKERADSVNDPRLNDDFIDEIFAGLPESLLNINYIYIKEYLSTEKIGKRRQDYIYRHIECIKNSPFDKAIIARFSSKIIDEFEKTIKECEERTGQFINSTSDEQIKYNLIFEHYEKIVPCLKILHQSFNDDIITDGILNDSCDFIYYKIPTASGISSLKDVNEDKYYKFIEILEVLDEYANNKKLLKQIHSDISYLKPAEAVEHAVSVSVSDYDGNALADVDVKLTNIDTDESYHGTTDSSGTCRISHLPSGKYYYKVQKDGYDLYDEKRDVYDDSRLEVRLKKEKPKTKSLVIRVCDDKGTALSDVNVSMTNLDTNTTYNITSDFLGVGMMDLPLGRYRYKVQKRGYESRDGTKDIYEDSIMDVRLEKEKISLEIKVCDQNDTALGDVDVRFTNIDTDKKYNCTTDSSGFCRINIPSGKYRYNVKKDGYYSDDVSMEMGTDSILDIKLKKKLEWLNSKMN